MPALRPLAITDRLPIGDFLRDWYLIRIRCACGHQREPRSEFIRRVIGADTTIQELRQRLRCHRCGQRGATIEILQLPR